MCSGLNGVVLTTVSVLFLISNTKMAKIESSQKQEKIPSKNNVIETEGLETRCYFFSLKNC